MTYPHPQDDFDEAMTDAPRRFFGNVDIETSKVALVKGAGKVPYDPAVHDKYSILIHIILIPIDPTLKLIERKPLSWDGEFKGCTRPSIEKLSKQIEAIRGPAPADDKGWLLRSFRNLWVSGEFVPRPGNKAGETWTALRFDAVYADEAACQVVYDAYKSKGDKADDTGTVVESDETAPPASPAGPSAAAVKSFLTSFWSIAMSRSAGNKDKARAEMVGLLAQNAAAVGGLTVDAPQVATVIGDNGANDAQVIDAPQVAADAVSA